MEVTKRLFVAGFLYCSLAYSQVTDWAALFRDAASMDRAVSDAAREKTFNQVFPLLSRSEPAVLKTDLQVLTKLSEGGSDFVRLQVSGVLAVLSQSRPDGAKALAPAFPTLLRLSDDPVNRIRHNAVMTIVNLKPQIPAELIGHLQKCSEDKYDKVMATAIVSLVRMAPDSPEALRLALEAMGSTVRKQKAAVWGVRDFHVTHPALLGKLGDMLRANQPEVTLEILRAVEVLGPEAKSLRSGIASLIQSRDPEIANTAKSALARIDSTPR